MVSVNDGLLDSNVATRAVTFAATSVAPVVAMTATPLAYGEKRRASQSRRGDRRERCRQRQPRQRHVAMTANFRSGEDLLVFTNQNGIAGSFDDATGVLTLTGTASVANYQAALRSIAYQNTSEDPATPPRTVSVTVSDGGLTSNIATRTITVAAVNDRPTLTQPADVTVDEDSGLASITLSGIGAGAAAELQTLSLTAASADAALFTNPTVAYTSPNTTAALAVTPAVDAFGSTTVTATVSDAGAANATMTRTFTVTVRPINDPPTLTPLADRSAVAGAGAQSVALSGIGTGAANEPQVLAVTGSSSDVTILTDVTVTYASPSATGSVSFTPLAAGTATITVTVDDGGAETARRPARSW